MSSRTTPILVAAAAALVVAILGATATDIGPWYYGLQKPSWQPPDWLFGPVWTLIYALTALAAVIAWRHAETRAMRQRVLVPFWLSILVLIIVLSPVSGTASRLLLPYLAWVAFATVLNLAVVRLNPSFAA